MRLIVSVTLCFSASSLSMEVIVNQSVNSEELTTAQLRRIYTMRQVSWSDGSPIVVYMLPSKHPIHQQFSKDVLRIFPYQLDRIWNKLIFSGLGVAPNVVATKELLIEKVSSVTGAIGYVDELEEEGDVQLIIIKE